MTIHHMPYHVPFLSIAEIVATVQNNSDFPPTTTVRWQRYNNDINITEDRYLGSTEDLFSPTLVINRVDFDFVHGSPYRCIASNAEGSWTSSNTYVHVVGSMCYYMYKIYVFFLYFGIFQSQLNTFFCCFFFQVFLFLRTVPDTKNVYQKWV